MGTEVTMQRPQGIKRHADDELERDQRLAKRFDLLNIENSAGKLYVPVTATSDSTTPLCNGAKPARNTPLPRHNEADMMHVEDTKHRVFIHDLDEELAGESDEDNPIFIPDIERHLMKIPKAVLMNDEDRQKMENMQLVLYQVPASLTIPEEHDSVRRVMLEARKRLQDRQPFTIPESLSERADSSAAAVADSNKLNENYTNAWDDQDAMDLG